MNTSARPDAFLSRNYSVSSPMTFGGKGFWQAMGSHVPECLRRHRQRPPRMRGINSSTPADVLFRRRVRELLRNPPWKSPAVAAPLSSSPPRPTASWFPARTTRHLAGHLLECLRRELKITYRLHTSTSSSPCLDPIPIRDRRSTRPGRSRLPGKHGGCATSAAPTGRACN